MKSNLFPVTNGRRTSDAHGGYSDEDDEDRVVYLEDDAGETPINQGRVRGPQVQSPIEFPSSRQDGGVVMHIPKFRTSLMKTKKEVCKHKANYWYVQRYNEL